MWSSSVVSFETTRIKKEEFPNSKIKLNKFKIFGKKKEIGRKNESKDKQTGSIISKPIKEVFRNKKTAKNLSNRLKQDHEDESTGINTIHCDNYIQKRQK